VSICRPSPSLLNGILAVVVVCAVGSEAMAQPPSRDYPPTYSSRKAPWYDPFGWLTSSEKKPTTPTPAPKVESQIPIAPLPPGTIATPAWKWYGYGTPTPGKTQFAPSVPADWYLSTGATPGAVPQTQQGGGFVVDPFHSPGLFVDPAPTKSPTVLVPPNYAPAPIVPPAGGPMLPAPTAATDVDWKSSPAVIRKPQTEGPVDVKPPAMLGMPRPVDEVPPPATAVKPGGTADPRTPAEAVRRPGPESPDINVVPAPDIIMPPIK
jgi:hypothetical protein